MMDPTHNISNWSDSLLMTMVDWLPFTTYQKLRLTSKHLRNRLTSVDESDRMYHYYLREALYLHCPTFFLPNNPFVYVDISQLIFCIATLSSIQKRPNNFSYIIKLHSKEASSISCLLGACYERNIN